MKHLRISGILAAVLALAFAIVGPASSAQAAGTGFFYIVNKDTGKCLEWNGYNKPITQETCKKTQYQWWNQSAAKLCNYVSIGGDYCLGDAGREKPVYGRSSAKAKQLFYSSLRPKAQTTIGAVDCGYFKVVKGKVLCGARILVKGKTYSPKMMWIIKY
ncbi:hypothetical protein GTY41_41565 [Streptomyces sp. SID685]|uniref:RICIN domain-containing protein n=1 Tax=Streptomyces TaxID=1883 RepID=UPI00136A1069|nr:hypothetical protein [Streptomyces sp. SID685]MYR91234.1 hypothetical protein [Streptomyces sp. SID685]